MVKIKSLGVVLLNRLLLLCFVLAFTCLGGQSLASYSITTDTNGTFTDMTGATTLLTSYSDDNASAVTNIGFTFKYCNSRYTSFFATSDGQIGFGTTAWGHVLDPSDSYAIIAPCSGDNSINDITEGTDTYLQYKLTGEASHQVLTVEWQNFRVPYGNTSGQFNRMQVRLYEGTNVVEMLYGRFYAIDTTINRAIFFSYGSSVLSLNTATLQWSTSTSSPNTNSWSGPAAVPNINSPTEGSRRIFTLAPKPMAPSITSPANGSYNNALQPTLDWYFGTNTTTYDLYFGTSNPPTQMVVSEATAGTTGSWTSPELLDYSTAYYWQVVEHHVSGTTTSGPVWSFYTNEGRLNYSFATSGTGSFSSFTNPTNLLTGYQDDNASAVTPIGFNFRFANNYYTQFSVNSNGQMRLGPTAINGSQTSAGTCAAMLVPMSGDNSNNNTASATKYIRCQTLGETPNRILVVEWQNFRIPYSSANGTYGAMQVRLYEGSNNIEFVYGPMAVSGTDNQARSMYIADGVEYGEIGSVNLSNLSYVDNSSIYANLLYSGNITSLYGNADGSRRVLMFSPGPGVPNTPAPALGEVNVTTNTSTLNWGFGGNNSVYDLYFGTSNPPVTAVVNGASITGNNGSWSITPALQFNTTYYWQVVVRNDLTRLQTTGPVWSFTTGKPQIASAQSSGNNFGLVYLGDTSPAFSVNLRNSGTDYLTVSNVAWADGNRGFNCVTPVLGQQIAVDGSIDLSVTFSPQNVQTVTDTLLVFSNAFNTPIMRIVFSGHSQYVPPAAPGNVRMTLQGNNALVEWNPVTTNIYGTSLNPDLYIVLYSEDANDSTYWFLTTVPGNQTSYIHQNVVRFRQHMYYHVIAWKDDPTRATSAIWRQLNSSRSPVSWIQVQEMLNK